MKGTDELAGGSRKNESEAHALAEWVKTYAPALRERYKDKKRDGEKELTAILGIIIAYFWPRTRFPHAGHVLISTWASSFHVLMNTHRELTPMMFVGVFIVLFIAVWLPCCVSDIVFPLLFVKSAPLCTHHAPKTEAES